MAVAALLEHCGGAAVGRAFCGSVTRRPCQARCDAIQRDTDSLLNTASKRAFSDNDPSSSSKPSNNTVCKTCENCVIVPVAYSASVPSGMTEWRAKTPTPPQQCPKSDLVGYGKKS